MNLPQIEVYQRFREVSGGIYTYYTKGVFQREAFRLSLVCVSKNGVGFEFELTIAMKVGAVKRGVIGIAEAIYLITWIVISSVECDN